MTDRPERPGRRPHTDGLPKTEPLTPAQVRQNAAAVAWIPSAAERAELGDIFPRTPKVALF